MEQAQYIIDEVQKAVDESTEKIIEEIRSILKSKNRQAVDENAYDLETIVNGYEIDEVIGSGGYGSVYLVVHQETLVKYAMKVIMLQDNDVMKSVAREISLLYSVEHENIIRMESAFFHKNAMFMVMEYVEYDLNTYLRLKKTPANPKKWLKNLLDGVAYLHSRSILHRDLKPENVLVGNDGILKLADFGTAREWFITDVTLTPEVTTMLYRAPELLLKSQVYTSTVDIWSIGCIFAEFEKLSPLFCDKDDDGGGLDELALIDRMCKTLGTPTDFPDFPQAAELFPNLGLEGNDLLMKMLCMNPTTRITAEAALAHPYFVEN